MRAIRKLWIDDVRPAPEGWWWAKSSRQAKAFIVQHGLDQIDTISFDHDLGGDDTTMPVMNYIEELVFTKSATAPIMTVHSQNPVGRAQLEAIIQRIQSFPDAY